MDENDDEDHESSGSDEEDEDESHYSSHDVVHRSSSTTSSLTGDVRVTSQAKDFGWIHSGEARRHLSSLTRLSPQNNTEYQPDDFFWDDDVVAAYHEDYGWGVRRHHVAAAEETHKRRRGERGDFASVCDRRCQATAGAACGLFIGVPLLISVCMLVLRHTYFPDADADHLLYSDSTWIVVYTPILFGAVSLLMSLPYSCLFAFWVRDERMQLLFWIVHVVFVALPVSMLLPLLNGHLTHNIYARKVWTGGLCVSILTGVAVDGWILILHASPLSMRSMPLKIVETVLCLACVSFSSFLLFMCVGPLFLLFVFLRDVAA
jgi:hypothetical protein